MHMQRSTTLLLVIILLAASILYLAGMATVPFHPDESTQLFMSADLETLFTNPAALFFNPQATSDLRQHYRLMDAPLPRYWIGLARMLSGQPALRSDWDWSLSWDENAARGALPSTGQLLAARRLLALLLPFSLYFMYRLGLLLAGPAAGWSALLLTALNALVLLHTRRAMAEGLLLFNITLSLWLLLRGGKRPWLAAVPLALAFLCKQSAVALLLPAGLALLTPLGGIRRASTRWRNTILAAGIFLALVLLFNPVFWANPAQAVPAALRERSAFVQAQVTAHTKAGGALLANRLPERLVGIVAQLYLTPPAVMDVGNYRAALASAESEYLGNPLHTLLRGFAGGGLLLLLAIFGLLAGSLRAIKEKQPGGAFWLFTLTGLAQAAALLLVPVPFQRYSIALVPYAVLFAGIGIALIWDALRTRGIEKPPISKNEHGGKQSGNAG